MNGNENGIAVRPQNALVNGEMTEQLFGDLMQFHPASKGLGNRAPAILRGVALLCVAIGANPAPSANEIHITPDGKIIVGINYFRRKAEEMGGIIWDYEPRPMSQSELNIYAVQGDKPAIFMICRACKRDDYFLGLKAGMSDQKAFQRFGRIGEGKVYLHEKPKNGRSHAWSASKRAEVDALRKLFPNLMKDTAGVDVDVTGEMPEYDDDIEYTTVHANSDFFGDDPEPAGAAEDSPDWDGMESHDVVDGDFEEEVPWEDEPNGFDFANATFPEFLQYCVDTIDRYDHQNAVKGALGKLGFTSWPGSKNSNYVAEREAMYADLKLYVSFRAAGMRQDDAIAAMADDLFATGEEE